MSFDYAAVRGGSTSKGPSVSSSLRKPKVIVSIAVSAMLLLAAVHLISSPDKVQWQDLEALKDKIPGMHTGPPVSGSNASDFANYEYWREHVGNPIPQVDPEGDHGYTDRIIGHAEDAPSSVVDLSVSKQSKQRAIFLPTYCLVTDLEKVDIVAVLSNRQEAEEFETHAVQFFSKPCPEFYGRFKVRNPYRPIPNLKYVNMYDVLPATLKLIEGVNENNTQPLHNKFGKYKYQGIKKLQTTRYFNYRHVLYLDSEGVAVQPFSIVKLFDRSLAEPIIWRSRNGWLDPLMKPVMERSAQILGRSINSFGTDYWNLESLQWVVEREIVEDLYMWVERSHGRSFWDVYVEGDHVFEITLYYMHIAARKLETTNSLFNKFKVLEVERELIRFGLGPALKRRKEGPRGGVLEFIATILKEPGVQPLLSAFLNRYNFQLIRMDGLDAADRNTLERFFLDTPISMLVCGTPDVHKWWNSTFEDPEPMEWNEAEKKASVHKLAGLYDPSALAIR